MRSPFLTAIFHPLNLLMAGLAAFAGLVSAWWLFPVGLLFWGVMVFNVARDQSLRLNYEMQQRAPLAPRFQRYFDRVERAQVGIFNTLASAPATLRRALQPVRDEMDVLTKHVYALCQRMSTLENYRVVSQSHTNLTTDLEHINSTLARVEDAAVQRDYEESRQALQERLAKLQAISTQLERVEAQLMSLAHEMDGIVTEVVRLQASGVDSAAALVPTLVARLRQETLQLQVFEKEAARL
jgi:chromosome segregation ATPase